MSDSVTYAISKPLFGVLEAMSSIICSVNFNRGPKILQGVPDCQGEWGHWLPRMSGNLEAGYDICTYRLVVLNESYEVS